MQKFKAVMLDIDGTITELGTNFVPDFLKEKLREVVESGIKVAICSGRHDPQHILERIKDIDPEKWVLIGENGACGYVYRDGEFEELYRVPWPSEVIDKNELAKTMHEKMTFGKFLNNESTLIFQPDTPLGYNDMDALIAQCDKDHAFTVELSKELGILDGLHVNNSKIGVVIGPADGDKDRGILEFAKHLGLPDTREILCIGDQPGESCNDQCFLNGKYGTPYSVGTDSGNAKQIFDNDGKVLIGPRGTFEILEKLIS